MKRTILIITLCSLISFSCEDQLELEPISEFTSASFYKTQEDLENAVNASYASLQSDGQYGQNFSYLMTVRSDIATVQSLAFSGSIYGDIESFSLNPLNFIIEQTWEDIYQGIQRCNIVLNRIDGVSFDEELRQIRKGEIKFLRALMYFNAVRLWGDIPLVLNETEDPLSLANATRTPVDQVYEQIILDLQESIEALPTHGQQDTGRASKEAAQVLLAKVYLTLQNYPRVVSTLNNVVGSFNLLQNFEDVFDPSNKNHAESIFDVQFNSSIQGEGSMYANLFAPNNIDGNELVNGTGRVLGLNLPTEEFLNSFTSEDARRGITIDRGATSDVLFQKKYLDPSPIFNPSKFTNTDCNNNFIVLRYADVLLMLAEALNEISYVANGDAFNYLNQVHQRAGLEAYTNSDLPDKERFREAVLAERAFELSFENHRWFDLLRTGNALEVMNNHTSFHGQFNVSDFQLLYPIPQSQIDAGSIDQNPGY